MNKDIPYNRTGYEVRIGVMKDTRLIDLYGYSLSVLFKCSDYISWLFLDDSFGKVVCKIPCEHPLYREINRNSKYHLQVELKGKTKVKGRSSVTYNELIVKSSELL
jgi:hypothetical protein